MVLGKLGGGLEGFFGSGWRDERVVLDDGIISVRGC